MQPTQTLTGHTIAWYLPRPLPQEKKIQALWVTTDVRWAILNKLPIAFSYDRKYRLIIPTSLYVQEKTWAKISEITDRPRGYPHMRTVESPWSRRAIGFDGLQLLGPGGSEEVWRSYHVDRVENLRLLRREEIVQIFPWIDDDGFLRTPTEPPEWHVRNWNYWFRQYIIERDDSRYDLRAA